MVNANNHRNVFLDNPRQASLWEMLRYVNQCLSILFWQTGSHRTEIKEGQVYLKLLITLVCETNFAENLSKDMDNMLAEPKQNRPYLLFFREYCFFTFFLTNHLAHDSNLQSFIKNESDCLMLVKTLTSVLSLYSQMRLHFQEESDRGFIKLLKSTSILEEFFRDLLGERDKNVMDFSHICKKVFYIDTEECKRIVLKMNFKDFVFFVFKFASSELNSELLSNQQLSEFLLEQFDLRSSELEEWSAASLFYSFGKMGITNEKMKDLAMKLIWGQIKGRKHKSVMHSLVFIATMCDLNDSQQAAIYDYLKTTIRELAQDMKAKPLVKLANRVLMNFFARGLFDLEVFKEVVLANLSVKNKKDLTFGRMINLVKTLNIPQKQLFLDFLHSPSLVKPIELGCQAFHEHLEKLEKSNRKPSYLQTVVSDLLRKAGFKTLLEHRIQNHIVDIYVPELKLMVEIDGQGHFIAENQTNIQAQLQNNMTTLRNEFIRSIAGFEDHELLSIRSSFDHDLDDRFLDAISAIIRRKTNNCQA